MRDLRSLPPEERLLEDRLLERLSLSRDELRRLDELSRSFDSSLFELEDRELEDRERAAYRSASSLRVSRPSLLVSDSCGVGRPQRAAAISWLFKVPLLFVS